MASYVEKHPILWMELDEITRNNKVDYAVVYGEFMYKAKSWPLRTACGMQG